MKKTINSDLIRGNINTIILKSLYNGDRYGYDIIREIRDKSHGQYILKQPTLYSCLKRLENQGFIRGCWGEESNGGRRKYYTLTDLGREVFVKNQDEYEFSRTIIDQLISERDYDLYSVERPIEATEFDAEIENDSETSQIKDKNSKPVPAPSQTESAINIETNRHNDAVAFSEPTQNGEIIEQGTNQIDFDALFGENNAETTYTVNATTEPTQIETATTSVSSLDFIEETTSIETTTQYQFDTQIAVETEQVQQPEAPAPEIITEPQQNQPAQVEFIRYNTQPIIQQAPTAAPVRPSVAQSASNEYRDTLSSLIDGFNSSRQVGASAPIQQQAQQPKIDEIRAKSDLSVKEKIQVKNFGRLTESIREMGDSVKIRTQNPDAIQQYNNKYYYYKNKLALYQYGFIFLVMILEAFLSFVIIKRGFGINTPNDNTFYVTTILLSLLLPVFAGLSYLFNPLAKKRLEYNFKSALIFRIIIALQICLITYALCVYFNMPISGSPEYALYLTIPMLLSTNIPLSTVIFNKLYKSKKFSV